jgi:alkylated DNA repair dioxygenase AlkB
MSCSVITKTIKQHQTVRPRPAAAESPPLVDPPRDCGMLLNMLHESDPECTTLLDWLDVNDRWETQRAGTFESKNRRRDAYGREGSDPVPTPVAAVGALILRRLRSLLAVDSRREMFTDDLLQTVTIMKYVPGDGLGKHKDTPRVNPFVLGVTICRDSEATRTMRWRDSAKQKYDMVTPAGSAYYFFGDAFDNWTHESLPSRKHKCVMYSLTFRRKRA